MDLSHVRTLLLLSLVFFVSTSNVVAATVDGRLTEPGVVWVTDEDAVRPMVAEMRNSGKAFVPNLLAVTRGSTIRFPNDDPFFHSIYSTAEADPFDIGFYPAGPGKDEVFPRTGVLEVRCHIHALMRANIVVVDGPFAVVDATFALSNVGAGERVVHAWSAERGLRAATVRVPAGDGSVVLPRAL